MQSMLSGHRCASGIGSQGSCPLQIKSTGTASFCISSGARWSSKRLMKPLNASGAFSRLVGFWWVCPAIRSGRCRNTPNYPGPVAFRRSAGLNQRCSNNVSTKGRINGTRYSNRWTIPWLIKLSQGIQLCASSIDPGYQFGAMAYVMA